MKEITCKRIEFSPDKWQNVWIIFNVIEDGKVLKEEKISLPRVERKEVRVVDEDEKGNRIGSHVEMKDVNALHNGCFTHYFAGKASKAAVAKYYPRQMKAVENYVKTTSMLEKAANRIKRLPASIALGVDEVAKIIEAFVGVTDKQAEAWALYHSVRNRVELFGREGADVEEIAETN